MNESVKRLGKNTVLVFLGNIGSKVISILMLPLYTRWLSVEDYGLTDIITVYVTLLFSITTCCIGEALFIFPKGVVFERQKSYFSSTFIFLFASGLVVLCLFTGINTIAPYFSISNAFVDNIWLIYLMLLSYILQQTTQQFTRCIDKMVVYSVTGIVYTLFTAIYAFVFIPKLGVSGYVYSIIMANITSALYSFLASQSYKYFSFKYNSKEALREMLKYSIPLIPNGIMWWLVNALNRPLMEKYLGFHDLGLYALANKFPGLLSMVAAVFFTSWQISVIEEFKKDGFNVFYNKVFRIFVSLLYVLLIAVTLFSKQLVAIFATGDYADAWRYIPLLTISVLFSSIGGFVGTIFSATRESKYFFYSSALAAITAVLSNIILIPLWGLYGACVSMVLPFVVLSISRLFYSKKDVKYEDMGALLTGLSLCVVLVVIYILELNIIYVIGLTFLTAIYLLYINRGIIRVLLNNDLFKKKIYKR